MVQNHLELHEDLCNYSYTNSVLPCAPTVRYPDFVWVLSDRVVILEVDEDCHRYYNRQCEVTRVCELMEATNCLPLVLIRFNPLKSLLEQMSTLVHNCFTSSISNNILTVHFLGYGAREYDLITEIETLGRQRK
jgi:hypothetical protein